MKVLHISIGVPLSSAGGVTLYVRALTSAQARMGLDVHVLARPEKEPLILDGVNIHTYVPSSVVPFALRNTEKDPSVEEVWKLLREERFDLVHFHMVLDFPLEFFRDFPAMGIPYVVSLHDYSHICPRIFMYDSDTNVCRTVDLNKCRTCISAFDQIEILRRAQRKFKVSLPRIPSSAAEVRMQTMKPFLERANLLLPVSNRTSEIYREVAPEGRFRTEQIGNESAVVPPAVKTPSPKLRVTALSTLSKMKGAGVLEALMKRVTRNDIEFQFFGRAYEGFDERLRKLGLVCRGSYAPSDIPRIMSETDIGLVLPIWEDNGPQIAMEFINNHVYVLGTTRGGVPDLVAENAGMLFDPDDSAQVDRVAAWLQNVKKSDIEAMSAGIQRLKTPDEHAEQITALYAQVV